MPSEPSEPFPSRDDVLRARLARSEMRARRALMFRNAAVAWAVAYAAFMTAGLLSFPLPAQIVLSAALAVSAYVALSSRGRRADAGDVAGEPVVSPDAESRP